MNYKKKKNSTSKDKHEESTTLGGIDTNLNLWYEKICIEKGIGIDCSAHTISIFWIFGIDRDKSMKGFYQFLL